MPKFSDCKMAARRRTSPLFEERSVQAPGMMRHGSLGSSSVSRHTLDRHPHSQLLENKIIVQEDEIEQLATDNHKLSAIEVTLKQELGAPQQELRKLKAYIRSNQTESDIQIRNLLDKIVKMNADIRARESVKKDLQRAHNEAHTLVVVARQDLAERIHLARKELQKTCLIIRSLPDLQSELVSLKQEYQILRGIFENEKSINVEQGEQLKATERHLIGMAREVQRLRSEILNIEKRVQVPTAFCSLPAQDSATFVDGYAITHAPVAANPNVETMISYGGGSAVAPVDGVTVAAIPSTVGSAGF